MLKLSAKSTSRISILSLACCCVLWGSCDHKSAPTASDDETGGEITVAIRLGKIASATIARAEVVITGTGMAEIRQELTVSGDMITGTVRGIPAGNNRSFTLNGYDSGGTLTYTGSATAAVLAGQQVTVVITVRRLGDLPELFPWPAGYVHCEGGETAIVEVTNPTTGKIWMDRNLGASRAATSSTDATAYGDLYQWGRLADGHQCRTSSTTSSKSSTDQPGHGRFITSFSSYAYDWRSPQNNHLWQGVTGVNNPCPSGYRLPTEAELEAERRSWSSSNAAGAFASPLKWPVAGLRGNSNGLLDDVDSYGYSWSRAVDGSNARTLRFSNSHAEVSSFRRAHGFSVRCLKD